MDITAVLSMNHLHHHHHSDYHRHLKTKLAEIKLFTEWHSGFALFILASPPPSLDQNSHDDSVLLAHGLVSEYLEREMIYIKPSVKTPLSDIVSPMIEHRITPSPLWLELSFDPAFHTEGYDAWLTMIQYLLSILNKSRPQLEKMLNAPLFLHFDSNEQEGAHFSSLMVTHAPALWSTSQITVSPN